MIFFIITADLYAISHCHCARVNVVKLTCSNNTSFLHLPFAGALYLSFDGFSLPGLTDYLSTQTPLSQNANPWVESIWKQATNGCPWKDNVTQTSNSTAQCNQYTSLLSLPSIYQPDMLSTKQYDCVMVFAQAMHNLLKTLCPSARGEAARQCIADNNLYDFIRNGTFQSAHGFISFDDLGNSLTSYYVINHFRQRPNALGYESVIVGKWYRQNNSLLMDLSQINWSKYNTAKNSTSAVGFL